MATPTPDLETKQSPPENGLKRRQSETSEQENKRLRTSPGKTSPDPETSRANDAPSEDRPRRESAAAEQAKEPRRKSSAVNEKDRSRRLFGGLLGSLSQKGDNRTTKRRQEIESRKKAELQRQDDEHIEDKKRRLERLAEKRRRVKKEMQEDTMRNRHRNMLHRANFLQTSAQPRLFYKPWELRDEEEDLIDEQIRTTKAQIDSELGAIKDVAKPSTERNDSSPSKSTSDQKSQTLETTEVKPAKNESPGAQDQTNEGEATPIAIPEGTNESVVTDKSEPDAPSSSRVNGHKPTTASEPERDSLAAHQDEHDDHVVEGEEDTVIY